MVVLIDLVKSGINVWIERLAKERTAGGKHDSCLFTCIWRRCQTIPGIKKGREMCRPRKKYPVKEKKRENVLLEKKVLEQRHLFGRPSTEHVYEQEKLLV